MTAAVDDPLDEKYGLEFIDMFNSMIETCERMKDTIKRIQGSSNLEAKNKFNKKMKSPSQTSARC